MRDQKAFCDKLAEIWQTNFPDWRFGQLIGNLLFFIGGDPFFLEDREMMEMLKNYVDRVNCAKNDKK